MKKYIFNFITVIFFCGCQIATPIKPVISTDPLPNDPDDVAIWVNKNDLSSSIVFINDKNNNGGLYAFNLNGKRIDSIKPILLKRPNNLDIWQSESSHIPSYVFITERNTQSLVVATFSHNKFNKIDSIKLFDFDTTENMDFKSPMGIAIDKRDRIDSINVYVSRKNGPKIGYIAHYAYFPYPKSNIPQIKLVRLIGEFSGIKEIESLAVDTLYNRVLYSDESYGVRYVSTLLDSNDKGTFGLGKFKRDIEGIALSPPNENYKNGLIWVSDQQRQSLNLFDRKTLEYLGKIKVMAKETDGIDFAELPLIRNSRGTIFMMNDKQHNFHYYDMEDLLKTLKP
jgi:3-phytase